MSLAVKVGLGCFGMWFLFLDCWGEEKWCFFEIVVVFIGGRKYYVKMVCNIVR